MSQPTLFGIPNCDTVRKARKWLDDQGLTARRYKRNSATLPRLTRDDAIRRDAPARKL